MPRDMAPTRAPPEPRAGGRSLSTARAVLRVLALLAEHPEGVRADQVAEVLGKSLSTAYYLLSSLCEEGFAVHESKGLYRPAHAFGAAIEPPTHIEPAPRDLAYAVDELFRATHRRAYLGVLQSGVIKITVVRGHQGMRKVPDLGTEIRDSAHALAMGKVVLAMLGERQLARYVGRGLRAFTRHTITRPDALAAELADVRRSGFAVDREEFDEDFCCVAAPVFDARRRFVAAIGLSTSARPFDADRPELVAAVRTVARTATAALTSEERRLLAPTRVRAGRPAAGATATPRGAASGLQVDAQKPGVLDVVRP